MTGFTTSVFLSRNRVSPTEAFEGLELGERKLSCTVLRGLDGSNPVRLLGDPTIIAEVTWRTKSADTNYTCPCGTVVQRLCVIPEQP
jgi:hypothetical protein